LVGPGVKRKVAIFFVSLSLSIMALHNQSFPQVQGKYERKSISYINTLFFTHSGIRLSRQQQAYLLDAIKKRIEMERFDCNPLPDKVIREFPKECKTRTGASLTELDEILNRTVAKEIVHILDINKEMRAKEFLTEADRNSFVGTKAKDLGITAEDLEKIMNSAYIFVPFLDSCVTAKKRGADPIKLYGGIAWYRLSTQREESSITFIDTVKAQGSLVMASIFRLYSPSDKTAQFRQLADCLAKNLQFATRRISEFSLAVTLRRVDGGTVWFGLGEKEGVNKDDKYYVMELVEDTSGNIHEKRLGFVRVIKVGDNQANPKAMTKAKVVHGSQFEKGMFVSEHALTPLEICLKVNVIPVALKQGWLDYNSIKYFEVPTDRTADAYVGGLSIHYNLVKALNLSQTYVTFEIQMGAMRLKANLWDQQYQTDIGGIIGMHGGVMKKFYCGPLAIVNGVKFGGHSLLVTEKVEEINHKFESRVVTGFTFDLGVELALSINVNLGGLATYRLFDPTSSWTLKIKDKEKAWYSDKPPEVDFSGLGYNIYLSFSLPRFF